MAQLLLPLGRTRSVQGSGSWKWWAMGVSARRIIIADVGTVFSGSKFREQGLEVRY
jgi:hypothetical protein